MALALYRLGRFCFKHKWWVLVGWIAVFAVVFGLVAATSPKFATTFNLPGTDSDKAMSVMDHDFKAVSEQQKNASTSVLLKAPDGLRNHQQQINGLLNDLKNELPNTKDDNVKGGVSVSPVEIKNNDTVGKITVDQNILTEDLKPKNKEELTDILKKYRGDGLQVEATGALMQIQEMGGASELLGFAVALVIMIIMFAALVAAFVPVITAIIGVFLAMELVTLSAKFLDVQQSATSIIMMLGIAVSIDYALFIVSRYRSELNRGGSREAAAGRAVGTAGTAVVFAGLTVVIAVIALAIVGIPFITQMGAGAGLAVIIAVLGAITLIPALLGIFGRFIFKPRIPILHPEHRDDEPSNGQRVAKFITRFPIPVALIGLAVLVVMAIPALKMELGMSFTSDDEQAAVNILKEGYGEGVGGELLVVVKSDSGNVAGAADAAVKGIQTIAHPDYIANPAQLTWVGNGLNSKTPNDGATTALIQVTPEFAPSSSQTTDLVKEIRGLQSQLDSQNAAIHVGGQTAILSDISEKLNSALIPYLIVVVGLAFIILMVVFRSILIPLTATLGFLFSVAATFGVTVAIFQQGDLGLITHTQPIIAFLPIFLIGVVFGLAMDYQVFLVTRMREEYVHGLSPKEAVIHGYQHGSRVVTSAAIIMISVFAAFMLAPDTIAKMMGFALAAAVVFDAFIVRMLVIPALIALMGHKAFWLPKWLDKVLPNVDTEGSRIREIPIDDGDDDLPFAKGPELDPLLRV